MANRNKKQRRKRNKKKGAIGLLVLELVGVVAFAAFLTFARTQREASADTAVNQSTRVASQAADQTHAQQPRFTEVLGGIWEAGF